MLGRQTFPSGPFLFRVSLISPSRGCPWPCVFCDIPIFNEGKWRSRSAARVVEVYKDLQKEGYGAVVLVGDHFLLQPRRRVWNRSTW